MVDDYVFEAGPRQRLQVPDDQRQAAGGKHGLGQGVGQRTHAFAAASGQDHRTHQKV
jgi:hypothetical protein